MSEAKNPQWHLFHLKQSHFGKLFLGAVAGSSCLQDHLGILTLTFSRSFPSHAQRARSNCMHLLDLITQVDVQLFQVRGHELDCIPHLYKYKNSPCTDLTCWFSALTKLPLTRNGFADAVLAAGIA